VRFCDDFVVVCPSKARAEQAQAMAAQVLADIGLRLHPDKTRIVCLQEGAEGFDFLGFHHHMVASRKDVGRFYLQKWPSDRAMASIKARVRDRTHRRYVGRELAYVVEDLNPVLRGWGAYFRFGNSNRKFHAIDSYVHERLAILASNKHGKSGRNWANRFNYEWFKGLDVHRLTGTVQYWSAHALR